MCHGHDRSPPETKTAAAGTKIANDGEMAPLPARKRRAPTLSRLAADLNLWFMEDESERRFDRPGGDSLIDDTHAPGYALSMTTHLQQRIDARIIGRAPIGLPEAVIRVSKATLEFACYAPL
jgi:hypothetical protein